MSRGHAVLDGTEIPEPSTKSSTAGTRESAHSELDLISADKDRMEEG
jgi:hypothetical protein